MDLVVLVEAADPDPPSRAAAAPHPLRRPAGRRVALAAAAALVGLLVADAAADQTRFAALDAVPRALRPVGGDLRPLWVLDEQQTGVLDAGTLVDGVLVGPQGRLWGSPAEGEPGGVTGFVGLDTRDGTRLWSMPVTPPPELDVSGSGWCTSAGDLALCTAQAWGGDGSSGTWVRAWLLSPRDGAVVRSWQPAAGGFGTVAGELVEQSGRDAGGAATDAPDTADHVVVTASAPDTGRPLWTWTSPPAAEADGAWWSGAPVRDHWLVTRGEHAWVIDRDGKVRGYDGIDEGSYVDVARGGRLVSTVWATLGTGGPDHVWYFPDAGGRRAILAMPMWLVVDDGSAPDVLVVQGVRDGAGFVAGLDAATGDMTWTVDVEATVAVLVDGRLVLLRADGLTALDAQDGATLWTAEDTDSTLRGLSTDGEVAVAAHADGAVEAFDLADGRRVWQQDLGAAAARAGGGSGESPGAWVRLDTPARLPVVQRPDGSAVAMG